MMLPSGNDAAYAIGENLGLLYYLYEKYVKPSEKNLYGYTNFRLSKSNDNIMKEQEAMDMIKLAKK